MSIKILRFCYICCLMLMLSFTVQTAGAAPKVVVTIKPVHSIIAAIMKNVAEPVLLLSGDVSPHEYALRPSDVRALQDADLIIWVGPELESFMPSALAGLSKSSYDLKVLDLLRDRLLPQRQYYVSPGDGHSGAEDHETLHADAAYECAQSPTAEGTYRVLPFCDPHVWLDPLLMDLFARMLSDELSMTDPVHRQLYQDNYRALSQDLHRLDADLTAQLLPVKAQGFVSFHDAYQYFSRRYHLTERGALHLDPDQALSLGVARRLRAQLESGDVICAFAEPQFDSRTLAALLENSPAKLGRIDPLGSEIAPGIDAYNSIMQDLAAHFSACLKK